MARALTLATTMSMPPNAAAAVADPCLERRLVGDIDAPADRVTPLRARGLQRGVDSAGVAGADRDVGAFSREDVSDSAGRYPCCRR